MKIQSINITKFKNLNKLAIDVSKHNGLSLVIGNNASGKSNFLEALSEIFYTQFQNEKTKLKYEIKYIDFASKEITVTNKAKATDLPKRVVAVYSGEEDRLWKMYYEKLYKKYIDDILKSVAIEFPKMLYLNKFYWEISLLCLLISDAADVKEFIGKTLGITSVQEITFAKTTPPKANSTIKAFVDSLQATYTLEAFKEQFNNDPDLFLKLYLAFTDKDNKLISQVVIKFNNGLLVSHLSEGQKKQLLVKASLEFAGQEDSLFLFDEPDSHIHISNKSSIYNIISNPDYLNSRHIVITSHSPTLTKLFPSENIVLLENGTKKELTTSFEASKYLVNDKDIYRLLFTDKHILIVEGKTDDLYISKAIEHFAADYPDLSFEFLRVGGTDDENIKNLLDKIQTNTNRKIIIVVDRDEAGYKVFKKLFPLVAPRKNFKDRKEVSIEKYTKNTYFLMIPHKDTGSQTGEFLVEDYFKKEKVIELAKAVIDSDFIGHKPCKNFPDLKEDIKRELLPNLCKISIPADMEDFKVLLAKLNEIVLKPSDI